MLTTSTLRPGLLVSLKTTISGGVAYERRDTEPEHATATGAVRAAWETVRTIQDPDEHERAIRARGKARSAVTAICAQSTFGLLCPESDADKLEAAVAAAREIAAEFNSTSRLSRVSVYVITGRIARDDVEAVRAINSEVRQLLEDMSAGVKQLDVKTIRDAANKSRQLGSMLTPDAQARIQVAIDAARSAARQIVKAGEAASQEIDTVAIRRITEQRTAFLDLDEGDDAAIATPETTGRGIDFEPPAPVSAAPANTPPTPTFEF